MREIKFRAWDEDIEAFIPLQGWIEELKKSKYRMLGNEFVSNFKNLPNLTIALNSPNVKIMRYTGLKDKNGKEIYEGDILSVKIYIGEKVIAEVKTTIEFKNGRFGVEWGHDKEFLSLDSFYKTKFEVIGNIYENPELLEVEE